MHEDTRKWSIESMLSEKVQGRIPCISLDLGEYFSLLRRFSGVLLAYPASPKGFSGLTVARMALAN
jgi:hypothetical protein